MKKKKTKQTNKREIVCYAIKIGEIAVLSGYY